MHTFESWLAELGRRRVDFILVGGLAEEALRTILEKERGG